MRKSIESILRRCGGTVTAVFADGSIPVRAVLTPTMTQSWVSTRKLMRDIGEGSNAQFLYLGPAAVDIRRAERLEMDGRRFRICRAEPMLFGGKVLYYWGLAVPLGEELIPWEN